MAPSRIIGRALTPLNYLRGTVVFRLRSISYHAADRIHPNVLSSLPLFLSSVPKGVLSPLRDPRFLSIHQQIRNQSDFLKQRAVEALKSKRNAAATAGASGSRGSNDDKNKNESFGKDPAANAGNMVDKVDEFGDDHQLEGLAAAAANPPPPSNERPVALTSLEVNADELSNHAASTPFQSKASSHTTATGSSLNAMESSSHEHSQVTSNVLNAGSNPWAHMQLHEFAPKIVVVGVGGAGTNAVNNMVASGLSGVEFLALNTDAQHLSTSLSPNRLQIGTELTSGLGCGANPDAGRLAAEESKDAIVSCIEDAHMVFITAGMGGGTGTGAAPVVAGLCYDLGILTVSVVTTPFRFEGTHRKRLALEGVERLKDVSDTLIVVPNQNLFRLVGEKTSFVESFRLADNVLLAGVRSITDLMTSPGLINLDFADVQSVMHGMGNALLGTGQACHDDRVGTYGIGEKKDESKSKPHDECKESNTKDERIVDDDQDECRAIRAAKMALNNPLLGNGNMDIGSAKGMLVNITGGSDMTLYEVDRAAEYITDKVIDPDANIIFGSAYDANLTGCVRVSVVATGIEENAAR